ncbi:peptidoglycan bridge formation glycyltransferase FemA/FemB family protein [Patescibacteria group bacterium]|nr:peptidoglycan bridge formation glycyltransferase FemA/FemB family protein [Patescibacteria group bacterium]
MDRKEWNNQVRKHALASGAFLQSGEWGEFQRALGRRVERIFLSTREGELIAQAIRMDLPFGQYYWHTPKGPIGAMSMERMVEVLRQHLGGALFLRIEPLEGPGLLKVDDVEPSTTLLLDLTHGGEALLADMKSKTRYNIRLAERKGVVCKKIDIDYFNDFMRLIEQTTRRDNFRAHPAVYYRTMLKVLGAGEVKAYLAAAFYDNRPIAVNIVVDFAGVRTYLHGATSNLHRNVMAQYALHWYLMKDAMRCGFHTFDFWGIAPEDAGPKHSWTGITRYKKGFGGKMITSPGTFDLPLKHLWYSAYRFVRGARRFSLPS